MKILITISFLLVFGFTNSFAQTEQKDFFVNKSGDTTWCTITKETYQYIFYTENKIGKSIEKTTVASFKWNSKEQVVRTQAPNRLDSAKTRPRISLLVYYTRTQGGSGSTYSGHIYGFQLNCGAKTELGKKSKNLKPVLEIDKEAFGYFQKSKRLEKAGKKLVFLCLGTLAAGFLSGALNDGSSNAAVPLWCISAASFTAFFITTSKENKYFSKSIRTYNKNAGYGYDFEINKCFDNDYDKNGFKKNY